MRIAGAAVAAIESPYPLDVPRFGPACCEAEIDELLGAKRVELAEYSEFLSINRRIDAADIYNGYFLFSPLLVARQIDMPQRLHVGIEPNLSEVEVLPIGSDGGGNGFLMGRSGPSVGLVWKWDHERVVRSDGVAREGVVKVAETFVGFLERVALDWEHFVSGDTSWSYISGRG